MLVSSDGEIMRLIIAGLFFAVVLAGQSRAEVARSAIDLVAAARAQVGVTLIYDPNY